jgi:hypothetical protein
VPALEQFLGSAAGLSPATVTRLTKQWGDDHAAFQQRDLSDRDFVYVWADGGAPQGPARPGAQLRAGPVGGPSFGTPACQDRAGAGRASIGVNGGLSITSGARHRHSGRRRPNPAPGDPSPHGVRYLRKGAHLPVAADPARIAGRREEALAGRVGWCGRVAGGAVA